MSILYIAIILFGLTTIMGLYLSALVLNNKEVKMEVIVIHGLFTMTGFLFLGALYPSTLMSILFFSIATLFGLTLLYQDLYYKPFSKWLCYAHGISTITGLVFLIGMASQ